MHAHQLSALKHRQFLKYWLGSFASVGATQLQVMGLGWLVYELSGSSLTLGYLGAAAGLPAILASLFGGALADHIDKRLLLITTSLLTAALLGLLALLDWLETVAVWHVIAVTGSISVITGFDWPARQAIFPALIEREDMMSAVALTTIIWQATRMTMPALGGIVIALGDTWMLFVLCSLGFLLMFFVMLTLRVRAGGAGARQPALRQIADGVRFILASDIFLILIGLSWAMFFFATSWMQLMPAFADMLNTDEEGYGYLLSVVGVGAVTGTFLSGFLHRSRRLGMAMLLSALVYSAFVYLFALIAWSGAPHAFPAALGCLFTAAVFSSLFMITSTTVLQLAVPDGLRGRVMGFHAITYNLLPLGGLFAGAIANVSNPALAISITTSVFVGLLLRALLTRAGVRSIDGRALVEKA